MSDVIDVTPQGETIAYDAQGRAMVERGGQWFYAPQYDRVLAQPVQPAPMPVSAPTSAPVSSQNTMLAFFTGTGSTGTENLPSYMLQADVPSSMDGQDSTMVDTIRIDKRGDLVQTIGGVSLPPQRSLEVVILGCGPTGGYSAVYRSLYQGDYNENADAEAKKPVCWSYDNVSPAPTAPMKQAAACATCPMNVKGSGPNNTRRCGKSQYLLVALASDLNQMFRIKVSSKGIYAADIPKNEFGLKAYATLLKSKQANWECMVTRLECPEGLSGGLRFFPTRFLTEQEYKLAQELKMKLDIKLYINLDADQDNVTVTMGDAQIATVSAAQLGNVVQAVQGAVQQAVAPAAAQVVTPAPAPQPVPQPATVTYRQQLQAHPSYASLPQNIKDYLMHPQVSDADVQNYVATYLPHLNAPATPPAPVVPTAPAASPVVAPAAAQVATPAPVAAAPAPARVPVQPSVAAPQPAATPAPAPAVAPQAASVAAPAPATDAVMPPAPAEVTATGPAAAPTPAQGGGAPVVQTAQDDNIANLLAQI